MRAVLTSYSQCIITGWSRRKNLDSYTSRINVYLFCTSWNLYNQHLWFFWTAFVFALTLLCWICSHPAFSFRSDFIDLNSEWEHFCGARPTWWSLHYCCGALTLWPHYFALTAVKICCVKLYWEDFELGYDLLKYSFGILYYMCLKIEQQETEQTEKKNHYHVKTIKYRVTAVERKCAHH